MKRFYTLLILLVAFVSTMFAAKYTLTVYYPEATCNGDELDYEICIYDSEDAEDKDFIEKKKGTTPEPSMYIKGEEVYKVTFSFDEPIYVALRYPSANGLVYRYTSRASVNSTATLYNSGGVFYDTLEEAKYRVHLADLNQKPEQGKLYSIGKEGISVYSSKYGNSSSSFSPTATSHKETVQGVKQFSYDVDASTFDLVVVDRQTYIIDWTKPYYYDGVWYATLKDIPINNELKELSYTWDFFDGSGHAYTGKVYCIGNNIYSTTTLEGIGINEKSISRGFRYCDKSVTKEFEVPAQRGTYNVTYIFNANTEEITANWEFKNSHVRLSFSGGGFFNKTIEPNGINTYKYSFSGVFYPGFYDYSLEDGDNGFVKENAYVEIPEFGIYNITFYYDANNGTVSHNVEKLQDELTLYYVNSGSWSFVNAYVWDYASGTPQATWPGVNLTKTGKTVDGFDVYSYTFDATMANRIIFNNSDGVSGSQTDNLTFTYLKPYYYDGIWYETLTFDTNGGGTVDPNPTPDPEPEPDPTPDPNVAPLYVKGGFNNWEVNDTYKLTSADGNYYVANYSAGNEITISGNFKISNEDWSVNYGGPIIVEAGKSYTLTAGGANLDTAGKIKASKVEFTLSTGVLKITGTTSSNEFDTTKDQGVAFVVNPRGTSPVYVPLTHSYNAEYNTAQYTGTYTVTELGVTAKIGGLTNFNVIDYGTNGQPVMPKFIYDMVKGAYEGFTIEGDYKVGDVLNIFVVFDSDWYATLLINVQAGGTNPNPDPKPEPEPTPGGEITLYYVNKTGWSAVNAYVWDSATGTPILAWSGEPATKLDKTVDGNEVYSYTFDSSLADRIIFNNGNGGVGNQTDDLTFEASKPYFYDGVWYETLIFDTNGGGTVDPNPTPDPTPDPSEPAFIVAGNGGSDATGIWCNGIEWNPSAEANRMKDADKDGIFEITYSNVPAGTWSFKVVVNTEPQQWLGGEFLDAKNSSAGYTIQDGGNIAFSLSNAADVTIKIDSADGKITLTTPSGNFGKVKIDYFSVANTDECLVENRFTAANNNTLKYTENIQILEGNEYGYAVYRILGNCNYAVYEKNLLVEVTEAGIYDITIVFNGDYENPDFTVTAVKQGGTTDPGTPDGPTPDPTPDPVVAIKNLMIQPFEKILPNTTTTTVATFTLQNANTATVSIEDLDADFFEIVEQNIGNGECSVSIVFKPIVIGVYYAKLVVTTDDEVSLSIDFAAVCGDETFEPGDVPELNPDPVNPGTPDDDTNVSVEEVSAVMIYAKVGTIYSEVDFEIYDLAGVNVTKLNGSLQGVYIVKTAEGNRLVSVW